MCDSVVALPPQTAAGVALFGKNSDRKPGECQPFVQHPAARYPVGAELRCTHVAIPQVARTHRVMGHSPWWVWGFEHGVNEHAVAIGNHTVFSRDPLEEAPGLIGMDLVRLGLERGASAAQALEAMTQLLELHGQGGAALAPGAGGYHNSFLIADPGEAWVLETSNRHWVARRTGLGACSNHLSLGADWERGSQGAERFARSAGFWGADGPLDFARAFRHPAIPPHVSEGRWRRARALLEAGRGRHDVASFARLLRDHGADDARDVPAAGWVPAATPEEERFFTLCAHSAPVHETTASLVAPLPARRDDPWPVWVGFGAPCSGVLLPVYVDGVLPPALARGGPEPGPDPLDPALDSAWWVFTELQRAVAADPPRHAPALRAGWAELETRIERERPELEAAAGAARRRGDRQRAAELLSDGMARWSAAALERARLLRAG